jgi:predicted transport protein
MYYYQTCATYFGAYCIILMESFKVIDVQQAKSIIYKNTKYKLLVTNAAVWCKKICRIGHPTPKYINIGIKDVELNMFFFKQL